MSDLSRIRRGGIGFQKNMKGKIIAIWSVIADDNSEHEWIRFYGNEKNLLKDIKHLRKYDWYLKYAFEINRGIPVKL